VQLHGTLEAVEAPADKARVLAALMAKYQPEGGHLPSIRRTRRTPSSTTNRWRPS